MAKTGSKATQSGLYECAAMFCWEKMVINKGRRIPPCKCGSAEWTLIQPTAKATKKKSAAKKRKRTTKGKKEEGGFLDSLFG